MKFQIINLNVEQFKEKLEELGASKVHDTYLYTYTYLYTDEDTMIKITKEKDIVKLSARDTSHELNFMSNIGDLDKLYTSIIGFYTALLPDAKKIVVEKKREKWEYDDILIYIDELPGLPQYIEIDIDTEEELVNFLKELEYSSGEEVLMFKDNPFKYYTHKHEIPLEKIKESSLTFDNIEEILK